MLFPDPEKLKRRGSGSISGKPENTSKGHWKNLVSQARAVAAYSRELAHRVRDGGAVLALRQPIKAAISTTFPPRAGPRAGPGRASALARVFRRPGRAGGQPRGRCRPRGAGFPDGFPAPMGSLGAGEATERLVASARSENMAATGADLAPIRPPPGAPLPLPDRACRRHLTPARVRARQNGRKPCIADPQRHARAVFRLFTAIARDPPAIAWSLGATRNGLNILKSPPLSLARLHPARPALTLN